MAGAASGEAVSARQPHRKRHRGRPAPEALERLQWPRRSGLCRLHNARPDLGLDTFQLRAVRTCRREPPRSLRAHDPAAHARPATGGDRVIRHGPRSRRRQPHCLWAAGKAQVTAQDRNRVYTPPWPAAPARSWPRPAQAVRPSRRQAARQSSPQAPQRDGAQRSRLAFCARLQTSAIGKRYSAGPTAIGRLPPGRFHAR